MFIFYRVCGSENGSRVVIRNICDDSHIAFLKFHIYGVIWNIVRKTAFLFTFFQHFSNVALFGF